MRPHTVSDLIAARCSILREKRADILNRLNTLKPPSESNIALEETTAHSETEIKNTSDIAIAMLLNVLFQARTAACRELRFFRVANLIQHSAASPLVVNTLLVITPLFSLEGIAMGITMMSAGDMNPIPALGYGLVFSAVNVALAVSAGFFCTRYLTYRLHNKYADEQDAKIRDLAKYGLAAHFGLLLLLVFSTLRVRATGHHEGIFDFSVVSLPETFDNGFTLAILAISFLSTIVGVYEGRHGFSDIVPGYSAVQRRAETHVDDQAQDLVDNTLESMGEHTDDSIEELSERIHQRKSDFDSYNAEIHDLHAAFIEFNNDVLTDKDEVRVYGQEQSEIDALPPYASRLDAFDSLLLSTAILPQALKDMEDVCSDGLIGRLNRAYEQASAQVIAAHAEFLTRKPSIEFPGPGNGGGYGQDHDHSNAHTQGATLGDTHA